MKKLVFNENTKEIDIIEREKTDELEKSESKCPENGIERVRNYLIRNKIFFEIFSLFFLGIMGAILSFIGWKTDERSKNIYQKQLEILENDREPYFTTEYIGGDEGTNGYFEVKNKGGYLGYGSAGVIDIYDLHYVDGREISLEIFHPFFVDTPYDEDEKKFVVYNIDYGDYIGIIADELEKIYSPNTISIKNRRYLKISYLNYENNLKTNFYKIETNIKYGDAIYVVDEKEIYGKIHIWSIYGFGVDSNVRFIVNQLESIKQEENKKKIRNKARKSFG